MAIRPVQIIGFQPDLAPDTPGVIVSSSQCLPTDRGIGNGIGISEFPGSTFSGTALGGYESINIVGTSRIFAATSTKIYELVSGTTVVDRSGSAYSAPAQWTWVQYGNTCLAINKNDRLQASTSGAFADAFANAPKASVVIVAGPATRPFAILFDYNDGTDTPHGIYWNPDPTLTWATSIATQVGKISVVDINGKFTAAVPYRDGAIAFKANAMYQGRYVGGSDMWIWERISSDIGCIGPTAVANVNDVIYFADRKGLWVYDGSYPRPMPGAIHQWWSRNQGGSAEVFFHWDWFRHVLWVRYASDGKFIAFNPNSRLWMQHGIITTNGKFVDLLISRLYAITTLSTFAQMSSNERDASVVRFNAIGSEYGMVTLRSMRPHWLLNTANGGASDTAAGWCSANLYFGPSLRNVADNFVTMDVAAPGRFDKVKTARYVQPEITVDDSVTWELDRFSTDGIPAGQE